MSIGPTVLSSSVGTNNLSLSDGFAQPPGGSWLYSDPWVACNGAGPPGFDEPGAGAHKGHEECFAAGEGRKVKGEHKRMKKK